MNQRDDKNRYQWPINVKDSQLGTILLTETSLLPKRHKNRNRLRSIRLNAKGRKLGTNNKRHSEAFYKSINSGRIEP